MAPDHNGVSPLEISAEVRKAIIHEYLLLLSLKTKAASCIYIRERESP